MRQNGSDGPNTERRFIFHYAVVMQDQEQQQQQQVPLQQSLTTAQQLQEQQLTAGLQRVCLRDESAPLPDIEDTPAPPVRRWYWPETGELPEIPFYAPYRRRLTPGTYRWYPIARSPGAL